MKTIEEIKYVINLGERGYLYALRINGAFGTTELDEVTKYKTKQDANDSLSAVFWLGQDGTVEQIKVTTTFELVSKE